ncbi:MAG: addiction module protein [Isosphaeraceae bacterium]
MSTLITALGIDRLSVGERLQLVQEIWDSLEDEVSILPLSEAQKQELDRRLASLDANPDAVVPWEEVEARALARFRQRHSRSS